jgi:hypothetical protein
VASAVLTPGARALVKLPHAADSSGGHPPEAKSAFDGTERSLPFETDSADHAETPTDAYFHIAPLLDLLAKACGKTRATLRIYDPFFCDGASPLGPPCSCHTWPGGMKPGTCFVRVGG